jgi:hypothetical protein
MRGEKDTADRLAAYSDAVFAVIVFLRSAHSPWVLNPACTPGRLDARRWAPGRLVRTRAGGDPRFEADAAAVPRLGDR